MQVSGRIQFVNPPKPGSRFGSLKINNMYVGVKPAELGQYRQGDQVTLEVAERASPNGKTWYDLVHSSQPAAPVQQPPSVPPPSQQRGGSSNDMMIFVTGVTGRAMQSGQFGLGDILALTDAARNAYERVILGVVKEPAPSHAYGNDLDDQIPF